MDTSGGADRGEGMRLAWRGKEMLRLFHHGKTGALPCLSHAQPRRQTPTCLCAEGWTLSRLINMPGHAAFYRSMNSRSDIFMRVCSFHHAITVINSTFNTF